VLFARPRVCIFLDARLRLWVSLEHAFIYVSTANQAERRSRTAHLLARWKHKKTTGGPVHKEPCRPMDSWLYSTMIKWVTA